MMPRSASRLTGLALLLLCALPCAALAQQYCTAPLFAPNESYMVVDDDNNLRLWGGDNYANAPVVAVLYAGDEVRLLSVQGSWAEVETRDGTHGFMSAQYLTPTSSFLAPGGIADRQDMLERCNGPGRGLSADLDGDGVNEQIRLSCADGYGGTNYFLDVFAADGRMLYQGPRFGPTPLIFCECNYGIYMPEIFQDLDGDRMAELLIGQPQSDASPGTFNMLRWNGAGFTPVWSDMGLYADASDPDYFRLVPASYDMPYRAVVNLSLAPGNQILAGILDDQWRWGTATVAFDGRGFRITRWMQNFQ